jgi:hypothetical protein
MTDVSFNYLDEIIEKANEAMGKKLSTKQRKSLKDSQFCGPGRSFPCNDCAHVTAAKRLLNRSKFSKSTKDKIRACINRKSKSLGCDSKEKSFDIDELIKSDIFMETVSLVEDSIKNPNQDLII